MTLVAVLAVQRKVPLLAADPQFVVTNVVPASPLLAPKVLLVTVYAVVPEDAFATVVTTRFPGLVLVSNRSPIKVFGRDEILLANEPA